MYEVALRKEHLLFSFYFIPLHNICLVHTPGVDALERMLSKCCPAEAVTCQEVIIDCLHHPDESVKMKVRFPSGLSYLSKNVSWL